MATKNSEHRARTIVGGGPARICAYESADPAAGANVTITVPAGKTWRVICGAVQLVTSGDAANRYFTLKLTDPDGNTVYRAGEDTAITASKTVDISLNPGVQNDVDLTNALVVAFGVPTKWILPPGSVLSSVITNLHANDNLGKLFLLVEEW